MTKRILFVCLGNICRSPTAEGVTRHMAQAAGMELALDSAGTSGWHVGDPPYDAMQAAARARDYDLSRQRARQFDRADFDTFDLILAMDRENLREVEAMRPPGNDTPARLFTDYAPDTGMDHVPDPYYTRDFDETLDLVEACAKGLLAET
ncbi:low molecular weight protein-tyrosine-phosphatase [Maritimibacter sp. UBA3975]|uniref:low molecular weight protein-tyrosine-phosphatase n=1 Tax=Maritimibacter sp. UBA3975 TaxID=1946833 RepID=UPI000C0A86D8|nr:low molecular weight protein-tyrosine-phosphatase [Maritimibacter sp. UBA3975]MAM62293.1 phosphotyrosine protein phosphatase [Maritimibacter sp.]|tara:strand:- start:697 stop:1146 length:450 start_codon:yes stop_codon:yes gene_type:complete